MRRQIIITCLLFSIVAACRPASAPQAEVQHPTVEPSTVTSSAAVATLAPDTPTPADWSTTASVDGDYYVLGNPTAPVRLIDYSDFL